MPPSTIFPALPARSADRPRLGPVGQWVAQTKARGASAASAPAGSGTIPIPGWSAGAGYAYGLGSTAPISSPFSDTVPWYLNPIVAAGIVWFARNFPVPDLHVVHDGGADDGAEIDGHWLPKKFDKPNELWSFFDFFAASVMSDITDGNTFWFKRKDGRGRIVDLWWLEPWGVRIVADPSRQKALLGYEYRSADVYETYRPDEIVHIRSAIPDRVDPRRGQSPLTPVDRSIRVTNEVGRFDEASLKNGGASPGAFTPADPAQPIPKEDIAWLQSWYKQNHTGPNAGSPFFAPFALRFVASGFSPEELSLDKLPKRHVSFILAAIGLSPMVLGYEDDAKTYANFNESCRAAYENALMPMQARFAEAINQDDDLIAEGERAKWDYAHVSYLQDDRATKIHSLVEAVGGPILEKNEARAELHYEPIEEPEPLPEPAQPTPVAPPADGAGAATDGTASDLAALLAARGGGSNGKPAGANGQANGRAVKAAGGSLDTPSDADLRRQTSRVLAALEAKLSGPAGTKANPYHDPAGRFAHGSGGHGPVAGIHPAVTPEHEAQAREKVAGLDQEAGGQHVLEAGPPETRQDRQALEKAAARGRGVVVRATVTPDVEARTEGEATHHEVGGVPIATVMPHPTEPGKWVTRQHGTGAKEGYDDWEHRTRARAESDAAAHVRKAVREGTDIRYLAGRTLPSVPLENHAGQPKHRTVYRVLVPEGEGKSAPAVVIDGIEVPVGPPPS